MPGTFSKTNRPRRPGAYFNWVATEQATVLPTTAKTVALVVTGDWGPFETPTIVSSFSEYLSVFGPSTTTQAYKAVSQAFRGEDLDGVQGAGAVVIYRMGASSAAKATKTIRNTSDANAITLTAKYEGTYGNSISLAFADGVVGTNDDFIVKVGGVEVERFTYADTNITALAADINANSDWIVASGVTSGTALKSADFPASLASGNDGLVDIAGADVDDALAAIETHRFGYFAMGDLAGNDYNAPADVASVTTAIKTWTDTLNAAGKRFLSTVGGAAGESASTAVTRSAGLASSDIVNVGYGSVTDDVLGSLSTSQLAPRIAGILASRGEAKSGTFARLGGASTGDLPSEADIITAFDGGVTVLAMDSHPTAPIRIEKALTTFTTGTAVKPYLIYRNPKFVATIHGIEMELTEWGEQNVIGQLPVNDATRAYIVGEARVRLKTREEAAILQPGSTVEVDADPPPTSEDEFVQLRYGVTFGRSVEQVYNTVSIA